MSVGAGGRNRSKDTYLRHRIKTPEVQLNVAAHAQDMLDYVNNAPSESIRQKRESDLAAARIDMSGYT